MGSASRAPLLERDAPLELVAAALQDARAGAGKLVLVAGEAGAGKTSLVREAAARAVPENTVWFGHCDPLATPRPLSPLLDMAADPDSGLGAVFEDGADPIDVFRRVLDLLRGRLRPVLVVVEDVHWADDATLDLLRFVGRRVGDTNAVVTCTFRDDEVGNEHPLRIVLGQLAALNTTVRVDVAPLSRRAVETLARGRSDDVDRLYAVTGGNAFYVTEVLAAGDSIPVRVQDAVLSRLTRLREPARRVAEAVSIAPRALEIDLVEPLARAEPVDIDEAVASGVLIGEGQAVRFRHELARAAVEDSLPPAARLSLHRAMIELLGERPEPDVARLAHHAIRAGDADLIVTHAPVAARDAARRGAPKQAIEFYAAALEHRDRLSTIDRARMHAALAWELGIADRSDAALEHVAVAIALFREAGDLEGLAEALTRGSAMRWRMPDPDGAYEMSREALAIYDQLGPSAQHAYALYSTAYLDMLARRADPAMHYCRRALAMAEECDAGYVSRASRMLYGTIEIVVGNAREGARILAEVREDAARHGEINLVNTCWGMLGSGGGEARLYDVAIPALEEGIRHGLATDHDYGVTYDRAWMARVAFEQGRWDDAVAFAELVDRTSLHRSGISMVTALGALGRVRVRRGDPGGAALLREVVAMGGGHEMQHVWSPYCGLAEHAWLQGRGHEIAAILDDIYRRALATDSLWARGEVGFWLWRGGVIDRPPPHAAEPFAAQMEGDWKRAAHLWREIGCPYEVALALADGDEPALREAIRMFDALGARPASNWARARLRELGVESVPRGPRPTTRVNPAGLTERQVEVMDLLVAGLSNGDIAERLFISKKTVEHHVSAIYAKIGASNRAQAIAAAHAFEDTPK